MNGEICVPLTITLLGIGEAGMPHDLPVHLFFLSERQRPKRFGEQLDAIDAHRHLTRPRTKQRTVHSDDVAEIEVREQRVALSPS